jgi:hypothetical protein
VRPAEERSRLLHLPRREQLANAARRNTRDLGHVPHLDPQLAQKFDVALPTPSEAEGFRRDDNFRADRRQDLRDEGFRLEPRQFFRELDDEQLVGSELADQLDAALERREELHVVAEDESRMRVEGDHRRAQPGRLGGLDRGPMP